MVIDMPAAVFPPEPGSVGAARHFVRDVLAAHELPSWPADLLVSELATNAIWHASSNFAVNVYVNGVIRVEVADDSSDRPALADPDHLSENGRGFHLVRSLAAEWGVDADASGKSVWFELALDMDP